MTEFTLYPPSPFARPSGSRNPPLEPSEPALSLIRGMVNREVIHNPRLPPALSLLGSRLRAGELVDRH